MSNIPNSIAELTGNKAIWNFLLNDNDTTEYWWEGELDWGCLDDWRQICKYKWLIVRIFTIGQFKSYVGIYAYRISSYYDEIVTIYHTLQL